MASTALASCRQRVLGPHPHPLRSCLACTAPASNELLSLYSGKRPLCAPALSLAPSCSWPSSPPARHGLTDPGAAYPTRSHHHPAQALALVVVHHVLTCRVGRPAVCRHGLWLQEHADKHPQRQPVRLQARRLGEDIPPGEQRQPQAEDAEEARRGAQAEQVGRGETPHAHAQWDKEAAG